MILIHSDLFIIRLEQSRCCMISHGIFSSYHNFIKLPTIRGENDPASDASNRSQTVGFVGLDALAQAPSCYPGQELLCPSEGELLQS